MNNVVLGVFAVLLIGVGIGVSAMMVSGTPLAGTPPVAVVGAGGSGNGVVLAADGVQDVYVKALGTGVYDHPQLTVKNGVPVRLHFSTDGRAGCGSALYLDGFGVRLVSSGEEQVATFTPTQAGSFAYHCGMNMFRGRLVVV